MRLFRGSRALRLWCSLARRLALLHLLLLSGMLLLDLLRLLSVTLFHLLFLRVGAGIGTMSGRCSKLCRANTSNATRFGSRP